MRFQTYLDEEKTQPVPGLGKDKSYAYLSLRNAYERHHYESVALYGYSHGGGSVRILAGWLADENITGLAFTSYVDAIRNHGAVDQNAEEMRPSGTSFHVNDYQPHPSVVKEVPLWVYTYRSRVNGVPTKDTPPNLSRKHDMNGNGDEMVHGNIDDDEDVQAQIVQDFVDRGVTR